MSYRPMQGLYTLRKRRGPLRAWLAWIPRTRQRYHPAFLQGQGRITRGRLLFWVSHENLFCNPRLPLTDQYPLGNNRSTALCSYQYHCFPSSRLPYPVLPIPQVAVSVLSTNELWALQLKTQAFFKMSHGYAAPVSPAMNSSRRTQVSSSSPETVRTNDKQARRLWYKPTSTSSPQRTK